MCCAPLTALATAFFEVKASVHLVTLTTASRSQESPDQIAEYAACQGAAKDLRVASTALAVPRVDNPQYGVMESGVVIVRRASGLLADFARGGRA